MRRSGGTIVTDGDPLTTPGWRRIREWRKEWLALPSQMIPAVIGPDQVARPGINGLATWPNSWAASACDRSRLRVPEPRRP